MGKQQKTSGVHTAALPVAKPGPDARQRREDSGAPKRPDVAKRPMSRRATNPISRQSAATKPSRELVRAIQRELRSKKYKPGGVDGVVGVTTRGAIMAYEYDMGLALSGQPSYELLKRLLLGPSFNEHLGRALARKREWRQSAVEMTRIVQNVLAKLGYAPGVVDGALGDATKKAIRSFEEDYGLPQTGRISGRLVQKLRRVSGEDLKVRS